MINSCSNNQDDPRTNTKRHEPNCSTSLRPARSWRDNMSKHQLEHLTRIPGNLKAPAIISLLVVLPFVILELVNRRNLPQDFPVMLFLTMWLLPLFFILALMPILRNLRAANRSPINPLSLVPRVLLMIFIAWFWIGLTLDQMPCFLGVPNCD